MERSEPTALDRDSGFAETLATNEAYASGVSWAAVIAGAFVAAALSLILLTLGTGLDFVHRTIDSSSSRFYSG